METGYFRSLGPAEEVRRGTLARFCNFVKEINPRSAVFLRGSVGNRGRSRGPHITT